MRPGEARPRANYDVKPGIQPFAAHGRCNDLLAAWVRSRTAIQQCGVMASTLNSFFRTFGFKFGRERSC